MDFKQFLSNTQMGKVVVRFLKKEPTADAQGKMVLTAEEEQKLTEHFGPNFVSLLKEKTFSTEDEQANDLYEAALHHATEQVEARFTSQIKQLQNDIATLAAKPEDLPGATTAIEGIRNFQRGQFKADMALAHNKAAAAFLQRGVMADTPTIEVEISARNSARICRRATTSTFSSSSTRASLRRSISRGKELRRSTRPSRVNP